MHVTIFLCTNYFSLTLSHYSLLREILSFLARFWHRPHSSQKHLAIAAQVQPCCALIWAIQSNQVQLHQRLFPQSQP